MAADIHEVHLLVMHLVFSLSLSPYLDGVCLSSEVTSSSQEARRTRKRYFFTLLLNFVFPLQLCLYVTLELWFDRRDCLDLGFRACYFGANVPPRKPPPAPKKWSNIHVNLKTLIAQSHLNVYIDFKYLKSNAFHSAIYHRL